MVPPDIEPLRVFVSYRRRDSPGYAGRIRDALRSIFGKDHVFYDVATIQGGVDFAVAIREAIDKAAIVAVIIGPHWARRRLWDRLVSRPDWVRFEIEYARQLGKPILPIVVAAGVMPSTLSLPASLEFLSTINATSVRDDSWDSDIDRLIERLSAVAKAPVTAPPTTAIEPASKPKRYLALGAALLAAVAVVSLGRWLWSRATSDRKESTASAPGTTNRPPTTGKIEVGPLGGEGLMSATRFVFSAKGITDPDGDPIRYTWDFGDGSAPPRSGASVTKVYDRVNRFDVKLFVNDGKLSEDLLAAETRATVRDVTGTWLLNLVRDPAAAIVLPTSYVITLTQQGNQLSGRILPEGSSRSTVLTGQVEDPDRVYFGSEHAWWNDDSDAYFDLEMGAIGIQMSNRNPKRCGPQIPCLSALANKQ
jgi:hypothetical protein